jgi:hypothetical protein
MWLLGVSGGGSVISTNGEEGDGDSAGAVEWEEREREKARARRYTITVVVRMIEIDTYVSMV